MMCHACQKWVDDHDLHNDDGRHRLNAAWAALRQEGFEMMTYDKMIDNKPGSEIMNSLKTWNLLGLPDGVELRGSHSRVVIGGEGRRVPSGNAYWLPSWAADLYGLLIAYGESVTEAAIRACLQDAQKRGAVATLLSLPAVSHYEKAGTIASISELLGLAPTKDDHAQ